MTIKNISQHVHSFLFYLGLLILCSGCVISAGTHGNIQKYSFRQSKKNVNKAIKTLQKKHPEYYVPTEYQKYNWHYGGDSTIADKWIQEANADSVSFNFYFEDLHLIVWSSFAGHSDEWNSKSCNLSLIGYIDLREHKWKFKDDLTNEEKREMDEMFRKRVVNVVRGNLAGQ